jgi:regulator of RNase E activity RraA
VSVWSGDGEGVCYFGELISIGMMERGCVGALVDGGVRDISWIGRLGFPVYARYRTPVQSIGRWKVNAWNVPVSMRGATSRWVDVRPGDFILADDDGALVIPAHVVEDVLAQSEAMGRREQEIREEIAGGLSLADALAKFGHV